MANVIGQLMVELGINTAHLEEGLTKATYEMKKFGGEMSKTFSELGKNTSELAAAFGALGPAGAEIAGVLNIAGQAAGSLMREMAGVNKTFGIFAGVGAGVAAAFGAVAVAGIEMASHQAEVVKQTKEQAIKAAMTTEEFSRLAWSAKKAGVSQEEFASSMARFNNKTVQASQGNRMAAASFAAMGVTVTDANGKIKPTSQVLQEASAWFEKTADSSIKNNVAMAAGGRGFMNMIAVLNRGPEAFKNDAKEADALGITISKRSAEMAEAYAISMMTIEEAGHGAQIQIMNELLPTLQTFADAIVEDLKSPDSGLKKFASGIAAVSKVFLDLIAVVGAVFGQIGQFFERASVQTQTWASGLAEYIRKASHGDFKGALAAGDATKKEMDDHDAEYAKKTEERWKSVWAVIDGKDVPHTAEKPKEDAKPPNPMNRGERDAADETKKFIDN